ncbi:hypothetical protein IFM89_011861 [Coptis chinensis]|uniref:Myb/SANT-like domain-containing protein n=1 Tax=Coptis chinensis TaxID=261450 RepID=A0A835I2J0_9MAGN|nr:hypothetical protein IFM89_011861 [Coptis chinensis]
MSSDNDFERTRKVAAVVGAMAVVTSAVTTVFALADSIPRKPYVNRDIDRKLYLDGIINDDRMEETQQSVKEKSKQEKKNYRWTDKKENFFISFLAECARKGEKKGKPFSKSTFTQAAKAVSDAFNDTCTAENVVGRMKTTKAKYAMIKSLKERSGWAWDDELKMIKVDKEDVEDFIEDGIQVDFLYVHARLILLGSSGKAIADIQSETVDIEDVSETRGAPQKAKRSRQWEEAFSKLDGLSQQVSRLANAVSNVDQSFCD